MKKMLSILLAAAVALTVCPVLPGPVVTAAAEEPFTDMAVARVQFNLRREASEAADIVCNIPIGKEVKVTEYPDATWCRLTYRGITGYAKQAWLRFRADSHRGTVGIFSAATGTDITAAPQVKSTPVPQAKSTATPLPESGTPVATSSAVTPTRRYTVSYAAEVLKTGVSVGESETDEPLWLAMTRTSFSIRDAADQNARRIREMKKGDDIYVLAYGDDWCKVMTTDRRRVGYAKSAWIFHYHSYDRFRNDVPGWNSYTQEGWAVVQEPFFIDDTSKHYQGNDLQVGDIIFVNKQENGTYRTQIRHSWTEIDADVLAYHALTNWREAKAGDYIGGWTQYFGKKQGAPYHNTRKRNIATAIGYMDGTVIESGSEYSFLKNIGPITKSRGYYVAGITGGEGSGMGGGVCHTSTLMYEAALTLPFLITEREPHTDDGNDYSPLEFDATVGAYSDFRFINTLPYDIALHAFIDKAAGVITVMFECLETVDAETLANWNGTER